MDLKLILHFQTPFEPDLNPCWWGHIILCSYSSVFFLFSQMWFFSPLHLVQLMFVLHVSFTITMATYRLGYYLCTFMIQAHCQPEWAWWSDLITRQLLVCTGLTPSFPDLIHLQFWLFYSVVNVRLAVQRTRYRIHGDQVLVILTELMIVHRMTNQPEIKKQRRKPKNVTIQICG